MQWPLRACRGGITIFAAGTLAVFMFSFRVGDSFAVAPQGRNVAVGEITAATTLADRTLQSGFYDLNKLRRLLAQPMARTGLLLRGRAHEIVIEGAGTIEARVDGEPVDLPLPLRLRSMPAAVGLVVPREPVAAARLLSPIES